MNVPYRRNIGMYRQKIDQAAVQDKSSTDRFNAQKGELDMLTKTKQELVSMMPVSESAAQVAT